MQFHSQYPLVETLELADPLPTLRTLAALPHPFLLHSGLHDARAQWSFFGADPFAVFRGDEYDQAVAMWRRCSAAERANDPPPTAVPFTGGAVGYWAYDFGRRLERLPSVAQDDLGLPDVLLGFYDVVGAFVHSTRLAWLFSSGLPLTGELLATRASQRLDRFLRLLTGRRITARMPSASRGLVATSSFDFDAYVRAVRQVQERIRAGEIFQANLSQRWSVPLEDRDPLAVALALQECIGSVSPAPHAAFFAAADHAAASASPERFLQLRSGRVETRPIKGTRPRSEDPEEDRRLADELRNSEKDRAENVMIADVLRNDLGRVCDHGTVEVSALCELESFPQVHHLTTTIEATLRPGLDAFDLLHAAFPGGSITGAPKIRAMEILENLEPVRRHLYTGAMGYVDWRGDAAWNIAIRTATLVRNAVLFSAGGGITADSDPEAEYHETLHKAEGMRRALERVLGPISLAPQLTRVP